MKLPFFSRNVVNSLRASAANNAQKYGSENDWIEQFASGKVYIRESNQIVDPPPELVFGEENNPQQDAENAKRIFVWLAGLTPALAMEERLWAYLTHCVFPAYMAARWPVSGESAVHRRYLFEGSSFAALSRNGIARLWWAGYLTKDEMRQNPFELTEILFMRQDIHVSLFERSMGKCRNVRTGVLEFFQANRDWLSHEAFGKRIQIILKELNLLGGVSILDALPPGTINTFLEKVGKSLAAEQESGAESAAD